DTATTEIYTLSLHDALPIWVRTKRLPNSAKKITVTEAAAVEKARTANTLRSMKGCSMRSSHHTKTPRAARPATVSARVAAEVQPRGGASMIASTMADSAP